MFNLSYLIYFGLATLCSLLITPLVIRLAYEFGILDQPDRVRKIHEKPIPLMGGFGILASIILTGYLFIYLNPQFLEVIPARFFIGVLAGCVLLAIGGFLDDKLSLPAKVTWIAPALASACIVASGIGIGIKFITNPLGGYFSLDYSLIGLPLSWIFTFMWVFCMTYTTKILDGLDGLVSGIGVIGAFTIFFVSIGDKVNQPVTAVLSLILAGSLFGFLFYNFNPAKIFLGEAGSTLVGFLLGVLSIILGAKIATALLVVGLPILDIAWAIVRRLKSGASPFKGDRSHLHNKLKDIFGHKAAVLIIYAYALFFGISSVFLQSKGKLLALIILLISVIVFFSVVTFLYKKKI